PRCDQGSRSNRIALVNFHMDISIGAGRAVGLLPRHGRALYPWRPLALPVLTAGSPRRKSPPSMKERPMKEWPMMEAMEREDGPVMEEERPVVKERPVCILVSRPMF